jgi:hypothetical protein
MNPRTKVGKEQIKRSQTGLAEGLKTRNVRNKQAKEGNGKSNR